MQGRLPRRGYVGLQLATAPREGTIQTGLWVKGVAPESSASRAGVQAGDLLTHVERNAATDLNEVRHLLKALRAGDPLRLRVVRGGRTLDFDLCVEAYPLEQHTGARTKLDEVRVGHQRLRAVCVVPTAPGPHPVVFLLPSAHWASEEHPLEPLHPLPMLVGSLARAGIASLRVERSGMGDSEGPPCTRVDFAGELAGHLAGLAYLHTAGWADPRRIFLFGHSIGAMVAPLIAAQHPVAGIVTYGASAIPISRGLVGALQRHAELETRDPDGARRVAAQIAELIHAIVVEKKTPEGVFRERPDLAAVAPAHFHGDQAYHRVVSFYHQLEVADIDGAWRRVTAPCLTVHGENDWISAAEDSRQLAQSVGSHARYLALPGVDHHMSDLPSAQGQRLAPPLRDALLQWLTERMETILRPPVSPSE